MSKQVCHEYMQNFPAGVVVANEERIKFMVSHPVIKQKLDEWIELHNSAGDNDNGKGENGSLDHQLRSQFIPSKNEEYALRKREEGNLHFKRRSFIESIHSYNDALRFVPAKHLPHKDESVNTSSCSVSASENFAYCLGNRSAAYYEIGDWQNSLADTNLALKYGYPQRLKIKVLLRKVNIYLKLRKFTEAEAALKEASDCQEIPKDAQLKISQLNIDLEKLKSESGAQCENIDSNKKPNNEPAPAAKVSTTFYPSIEDFVENPNFENALKDVEIHYSQYKTRHVKCKKSLELGAILFREAPFSSVLIPEFYESHCFHCHVHLENEYFFPCISCSQVKFCSEACYDVAWDQFHQYECGALDLLHSVGIAHLALKTVLIAGKSRILNSLDKYVDSAQLSKSVAVYKRGEEPYHRVLSLLDHIEVMPVEDMFQYSLTASLLTNYLMKKTSFFGDVSEEDIFKIGGVLLKHVCQLICNAHAVTYIASDHKVQNISVRTVEESQVRIASAIYSSASIMNHSCQPNIASSFYKGRTLLVRLTSDLRKGGEVFNCYGPHERRMNRETRQEILKGQYFFTCDCSACERELEDGFSFVDKFSALKCSKCKGPVVPDSATQTYLVECQDCGIFDNIEANLHNALRIGQMISMGSSKLDEAKTADALQLFQEAKKLCEKSLFKFNSDFGKVNDMLAQCYTILGNVDSAVSHLQESIAYVQERFGESSVEYARELKKLGELLQITYSASFSTSPGSSSSKNTSDEDKKSMIEETIEKSNRILELYCVISPENQ